MTSRAPHHIAQHRSRVALLLIDVINDFNFPGNELLIRAALPAARRIAALKAQCHRANVPVVYVNDNFGIWRSDFSSVVEHCTREDSKGRDVSRLLKPNRTDYFVLKPKHSGFYSTTLDVLLDYLKTRTVIITGFAGNICVLFTANDAYMREFKVYVPSDCIASNSLEENNHALVQMRTLLKAQTWDSTKLLKTNMLKR